MKIKKITFFFVVALFWSCDSDFSPVGSEIVTDEKLDIKSVWADVRAYNRATGAVQTNGLPLNSLGVLENSVFGKSVISYVTQLEFPTNINPVQNIASPIITKVELTVPYFNTLLEVDSDQNQTFRLDSLYGNANNKFRLNIYESGYYLREFDPSTNFEERQKYYSDLYNDIYNSRNPDRLNNSLNTAQNEAFFFDKSEHVTYGLNDLGEQIVKEREAPHMKIELDKDFFFNKIFSALPGNLDNNNTFKNYFRGLFFQVEDLGAGSQMIQLDFSQGKITIYYNSLVGGEREDGTVVLNFGGNSVSLVQNQFLANYSNALATSNPTTGDEKLYIKGNEGSVAYLDLFPDQSELDQLRTLVETENWLINEANLVFYIDKSQMDAIAHVPQRIFLFDAENNFPLADYYFDTSSFSQFPKANKWIHDGFISNLGSNDNKGFRYRVKITKHVMNLLKNSEEKNVKIGISLTENINLIGMATFKDGIGLPSESPYRFVPMSSVLSPLGTVLYGNNTSDDKKLKLEIRYTKP